MLLLTNLWGQALGGALGGNKIKSYCASQNRDAFRDAWIPQSENPSTWHPSPSWAQRTGKWHPLPQVWAGVITDFHSIHLAHDRVSWDPNRDQFLQWVKSE